MTYGGTIPAVTASHSGFVNDASLRSVATSTQREPSTAKMASLPDVSEPFRGISSLSGRSFALRVQNGPV